MKLKLALPAGSLKESTFTMLKKAGFRVSGTARSYYPTIDDPEIELMLVRAQEIPRYVEAGVFDAGLTGADWTAENKAKVHKVAELIYAKQGLRPVRWVIAVPENSKIKTIKDLKGKRIATELVNFVRSYLRKHKVSANVEFSWGATEAKPPVLADAIVELTETGSSLRANNLRIIETILTSNTLLIANKESWQQNNKRAKIETLNMLLQGALMAESKVGIKMNVHRSKLQKVLALLPAMKKPTISDLTDGEWLDVETIIEEKKVRDMIVNLKAAGAQDIIEYPLNKVVL